MTKKLTEEEFETKFQAFLQEMSTDEDSLASPPKRSDKKAVDSQLWWLKEHGSTKTADDESAKPVHSWLKKDPKYSSTETNEMARSEVFHLDVTPIVDHTQDSISNKISDHSNELTQSVSSDNNSKSKSEGLNINKNSEKETPTSKITENYSEDFESENVAPELLQDEQSLDNSNSLDAETMQDPVVNSESKETLTSGSQPNILDSHSSNIYEQKDQKQNIQKILTDTLKVPDIIKDNEIISKKTLNGTPSLANFSPLSQSITAVNGSDVRSIEEIFKEIEKTQTQMYDEKRTDGRTAQMKTALQKEAETNKMVDTTQDKPPKNSQRKSNQTYRSCFCRALSNKVNSSCLSDINMQKMLQDEHLINTKLKAEIVAQEKEIATMRSYFEERVFRLEEQNVHLLAKLNKEENKGKQNSKSNHEECHGDSILSSTKTQKEFAEQEKLIIGYQLENETLCNQIASLKNELKIVETQMKQDKQSLLSELTVLRNKLHTTTENQHRKRINNILDSTDLERIDSEEWIELKIEDLLVLKNENAKLMQQLQHKEMVEVKPLNNESINEITALKNKILSLENEIRSKNLEESSSAIVINAKDAKIRSLENQVKQLEQLLTLRNPNSIPALVLAAGVAESKEKEQATVNPTQLPRSVEFLERRLQEMEEQQLTQVNESKNALQAIEIKFMKVKEQYKSRIYQLECQLVEQKGSQSVTRPQSSITALEKELSSVRQRYQRENDKLKNDVLALRQELKLKSHKVDDHSLALKVKSLSNELATKDRQIKLLQEKMDMRKNTKDASSTVDDRNGNVELDLKEHILRLKAEKQQMSNHIKFLEGKLQAAQVESNLEETQEASLKKLQETLTNREEELKETNAALDRAVSKIARITDELDINEITIDRLKEQIAATKVGREQIDRLSSENEELKRQCLSLREQLLVAQTNKNPEWKNFISLQARVQEVENKYLEKCEELQKIVTWHKTFRETANPGSSKLEEELKRWRRIALTRTQEIEKMRVQMDDIILDLERLEAQGCSFRTDRPAASISPKHHHLCRERPISKRQKSA